MRKSHFYEQSLVLLGPIISKFLHVKMRGKNKPKQQIMCALVLSLWTNPTLILKQIGFQQACASNFVSQNQPKLKKTIL
jgi:hypothetical protein